MADWDVVSQAPAAEAAAPLPKPPAKPVSPAPADDAWAVASQEPAAPVEPWAVKSQAPAESLLTRAAMSVPREIAKEAGKSWDSLKKNWLAAQKPDEVPKGFWERQKALFDSQMALGNTAVDAFNLIMSPITGAITGAVAVPIAKGMGAITPDRTGETPEQKEERLVGDVNTALMAGAPTKGGFASKRPAPQAAKDIKSGAADAVPPEKWMRPKDEEGRAENDYPRNDILARQYGEEATTTGREGVTPGPTGDKYTDALAQQKLSPTPANEPWAVAKQEPLSKTLDDLPIEPKNQVGEAYKVTALEDAGTPPHPVVQTLRAADTPPETPAQPAQTSGKGGGEPPQKPPGEPQETLPRGPDDPPVQDLKGFVRDTEDRLYQLQKNGTADKSEWGNSIKEMQKTDPESLTPARQERIYHALEEGKLDDLAPDDKRVYEKYIKPINAEEDRIYAKLRNNGVELPRDGYVHRMVQGKQPRYDARDPDNAALSDPVAPISNRALSDKAESLRDRVYLALDDGQGNRKLIATNKNGTALYEDGKVKPMGERYSKLEPGDDIVYDGKTWKVDQARTKEIEANTDTRYYKNALLNSVDNLLGLRRVERAVDFMEGFKKDPTFLNYAHGPGSNQRTPPDWRTTKLPQFEGWRMEPHMAEALDDFYGMRDVGWEWLTKANRFLTTSLFIDPLPHIHNVANHWYIARGWDNFTPTTWKTTAKNLARATVAVLNQDKLYQKFLRDGGGLLYGDVANRNFYEMLLKATGNAIKEDPERWGKISKAFGFNKPFDMVAGLYRASSRILWLGGDVFMLQRYLDNMDIHKMTSKQAIAEAERHIPNYRIPSRVMDSRAASVFLRQTNIMNFGRYRHGMYLSYAHMVNDLVRNQKAGARKEALGNMAALGALSLLWYPLADKALQGVASLVSGEDVDLDTVKLRRAGGTGALHHWGEFSTGERNLTQLLGTLIVPAPASLGLIEAFYNKNLFTAQKVIESDDMNNFVKASAEGDLEDAAKYGRRILTQLAQFASSKLFPVQLLEQAIRDTDDEGIRRAVQKLLDVHDKTSKQVSNKEKQPMWERRSAQKRAQKTERELGIDQ